MQSEEPDARVLGRDVPRVEDPPLILGKGRFVDDITLPKMLHACFVRSPHAHARILSINTDVASRLSGVHAIFASSDLVPYLQTSRLKVALPSPSYRQELHRPVLADREVVHVGEPIALVLADSRYVAEDAAALVESDFDPLPVVNDCVAGLEPASPPAHEKAPDDVKNCAKADAPVYQSIDGNDLALAVCAIPYIPLWLIHWLE